EIVDEPRTLLRREWLKQDRRRVHLAAAPAGADVEQLGSRKADEQNRGVARPVCEAFDQVEEGGFAPVDVVEDEDERAEPGEHLAVGEATAACDQGLVGQIAEELLYEPGLADTGRPEDREELARPVADGLLERVMQAPPLPDPADQRRLEAAGVGRSLRVDG